MFVAKPPPKTTTENLFEKMTLDAKEKSEVNRREVPTPLQESRDLLDFLVDWSPRVAIVPSSGPRYRGRQQATGPCLHDLGCRV